MKDEEKKNEYPTPSRESVRASYLWFIVVMIFMLVFCALFLSSASAEAGYRKFIMFLHYPPTSILEQTSPFTGLAERYGASAVVYSHCHGESRFGDSIRGELHGIRYLLVSGDYLNFHPARVLP